MWKTVHGGPHAVRRKGVPVVHLTEQFAVPSMSVVSAVKSRLSARYQHVSFRGAGKQWLTTRIQPSKS
jgi:hypothetical protein